MPLRQNDKEISNLARYYSKHWMLYKQKVFLNLDTYCSAGIYPSGTGVHSTSATFTWSLISLNSSPRFSPRIVTSVPPSRGPRSGVIYRQVAIETLPSFPLNKKQHGELPHPPHLSHWYKPTGSGEWLSNRFLHAPAGVSDCETVWGAGDSERSCEWFGSVG